MILPRAARVALVEWEAPALPLAVQAHLLSVSRASLYYQAVPPTAEELYIKRRIDEIYRYGRPPGGQIGDPERL